MLTNEQYQLNQLGWHVSTTLKEGLAQAYQNFINIHIVTSH